MRSQLRTSVAGAVALGLALGLVNFTVRSGAAEGAAGGVPEAELKSLVDQSTKIIDEALAGKMDKPTALKARTAAVMIAVFAQSGKDGANTPARATLRDAALQLANTLKAEKYDDAKKQVKELAGLKPNPNAKVGKVKILDAAIDLEDVMNQFAGPRGGGLGIEKKLEDLGDMNAIPPAELNEELLALANRAFLVSELVREHKPEKNASKWPGYADAMGKQAMELAKVVRDKKDKDALAAVTNLNKACNDCHKEFKK